MRECVRGQLAAAGKRTEQFIGLPSTRRAGRENRQRARHPNGDGFELSLMKRILGAWPLAPPHPSGPVSLSLFLSVLFCACYSGAAIPFLLLLVLRPLPLIPFIRELVSGLSCACSANVGAAFDSAACIQSVLCP